MKRQWFIFLCALPLASTTIVPGLPPHHHKPSQALSPLSLLPLITTNTPLLSYIIVTTRGHQAHQYNDKRASGLNNRVGHTRDTTNPYPHYFIPHFLPFTLPLLHFLYLPPALLLSTQQAHPPRHSFAPSLLFHPPPLSGVIFHPPTPPPRHSTSLSSSSCLPTSTLFILTLSRRVLRLCEGRNILAEHRVGITRKYERCW